jgi:Cys/Met metabolism PLP-dependent enzyme
MGVTVRFVDPADPQAFRRATDDRTRAYDAETLPNPKLTVFPIGAVAAIRRAPGVPLMDNTAAPMICRLFDHGAAVIVHSTTKYIGGHGTSIGGMIVDHHFRPRSGIGRGRHVDGPGRVSLRCGGGGRTPPSPSAAQRIDAALHVRALSAGNSDSAFTLR